MSTTGASLAIMDPLARLGLEAGATPEQIRARYLELVKQHPPERDPDRFAEINAAYKMAENPVEVWARRLCIDLAGDPEPLLQSFQFRPTRIPTDKLFRCAGSVEFRSTDS